LTVDEALDGYRKSLRSCTLCPKMAGPPVTGNPVVSPILLIGQAPGAHEIELGKPFAWTAGKTMFSWFSGIGLGEAEFRQRIYMAAVCRCFPGKSAGGGDRAPSRVEVANCSRWLQTEIHLLRPKLILAVGKLAITQFMPVMRLVDVIGGQQRIVIDGHASSDLIPLPHPSGASPWHRTQPGKSLLQQALGLLSRHPAWREVCDSLPGEE
jgi:uracil-DNA glycosylase